MRAIVLLLFLSIAGTAYADDDPLESLHSVEDTLSTMEKSLEAQAWRENDDVIPVGILSHLEREGSLEKDLEPMAGGLLEGASSDLPKSARAGDMVPIPGPDPANCALPAPAGASEPDEGAGR